MKVSLHVGFTLIEMLLALFLSTVILASCMQVYVSMKRSWLMQRDIINKQAVGHIAAHVLRSHLRAAKFYGCSTIGSNVLGATKLRGYLGKHPELPMLDNKPLIAGSDIVKITYLSAYTNQVLGMPSQTILSINATPKRSIAQRLLVTDCLTSEFFTVVARFDHASTQQLTSQKPLSKHYQQDAEVGELITRVFYVAETQHYNQRGEPITALWMYDSQRRNNLEIVEGVAKLEIQFAVQQNNTQALIYLRADHVTDWSLVKAMKIKLWLVGQAKDYWNVYVTLR